MSRAALILYLASVALLPWSWLPPFPWLHEHAQWSDILLALAAVAWALERTRAGTGPRPRPVHAAMALYLGAAAVSLAFARPTPPAGPAKLLGMASLVVLALMSSNLVSRPRVAESLARVVAVTSLATAAAALTGVLLAQAGVRTGLVGGYGDLLPGPYARAQAGLYHPNLLASFCVFATGVIARDDAGLPRRLRRAASAALWLTLLLTFSRGILAMGLAALVRGAATPRRRVLAASYAVLAAALLAALTAWKLSLDPTRPWEARLDSAPSARRQALASSLRTLATRPLLGTGPGSSPGRANGIPFDAHFTLVNVAATLGLPALAGFVGIPLALWAGRRRPTDRATWGVLAGLALEALAEDVEDFRHVWVAFGLADAGRASTASTGARREREEAVVGSGRGPTPIDP